MSPVLQANLSELYDSMVKKRPDQEGHSERPDGLIEQTFSEVRGEDDQHNELDQEKGKTKLERSNDIGPESTGMSLLMQMHRYPSIWETAQIVPSEGRGSIRRSGRDDELAASPEWGPTEHANRLASGGAEGRRLKKREAYMSRGKKTEEIKTHKPHVFEEAQPSLLRTGDWENEAVSDPERLAPRSFLRLVHFEQKGQAALVRFWLPPLLNERQIVLYPLLVIALRRDLARIMTPEDWKNLQNMTKRKSSTSGLQFRPRIGLINNKLRKFGIVRRPKLRTVRPVEVASEVTAAANQQDPGNELTISPSKIAPGVKCTLGLEPSEVGQPETEGTDLRDNERIRIGGPSRISPSKDKGNSLLDDRDDNGSGAELELELAVYLSGTFDVLVCRVEAWADRARVDVQNGGPGQEKVDLEWTALAWTQLGSVDAFAKRHRDGCARCIRSYSNWMDTLILTVSSRNIQPVQKHPAPRLVQLGQEDDGKKLSS
ncbi:unnamed protein product [Protopolystoma xenopodis]|uniref:Uncharacterized protein n=1 Tax=Protopolystoma xenopodis TaxID=117903 RepID=A0A448WAQ8_9PLAT|nr:unnamed protein product [Protopolystoma xenopodis]